MSSAFIRHILRKELDELDKRLQRRNEEMLAQLQSMVADTVAVFSPNMPVRLYLKVKDVTDMDALLPLNRAILRAADQAEAERILAQIGEQTAR
jgi:hypothetical protein